MDSKRSTFFINSSTPVQIAYKKNDWYSLLNEIDSEQQFAYRKEFQRLFSLSCNTETEWEQSVKELASFSKKWFGAELQNQRSIIRAVDKPESEDKQSSNIIHYTGKSGRKVDILLGSIHSEKGRTHLATLVLDIFFKPSPADQSLTHALGNMKKRMLISP